MPAAPRGGSPATHRGPHVDVVAAEPSATTGLRDLSLFDAQVRGAVIDLTDVSLGVEWSEVDDCHFTQRVRPVLTEHGVGAQGSFGSRPAIYRRCTFERVRFKTLGGFTLGRATFEDCLFLRCRWEGHLAHDAWLVGNRFVGRMNGCVWFGRGDDGSNRVAQNDFSAADITANVEFRADFPVDAQRWPDGYTPLRDGGAIASPESQYTDTCTWSR